MRIIPAKPEHIPAVREIYNQAIAGRNSTSDLELRSLEDRQKWFSQFNERYPIFVGLSGDGIGSRDHVAAYGCLFKYSPKEGYRFSCENSVYVRNENRGQGWGRAMLEHLITAARERDFHYMEALIFSDNLGSLRLHEKLGFQLIGVKPEATQIDGKWRDVTVLYRHV